MSTSKIILVASIVVFAAISIDALDFRPQSMFEAVETKATLGFYLATTSQIQSGGLVNNPYYIFGAPRQVPSDELADCQDGSPVVDSEGNPSAATASATHIYNSMCERLNGATPKNFVALDFYYGKAPTGVWILANPSEEGSPISMQIVGADPATFGLIPDTQSANPKGFVELFSNKYTKDKDHVYVYGQILAQADPNTFAIHFPSGTTTCQFDAFDSRHKYNNGELTMQTGCEPLP